MICVRLFFVTSPARQSQGKHSRDRRDLYKHRAEFRKLRREKKKHRAGKIKSRGAANLMGNKFKSPRVFITRARIFFASARNFLRSLCFFSPLQEENLDSNERNISSHERNPDFNGKNAVIRLYFHFWAREKKKYDLGAYL